MTSQVDLREAADETVIAISGELDAAASAGLRDRLISLIPGSSMIRLDLAGLTYISSAGLRTLLLVYRQAQSEGSTVRLVGIRDEVRFVMSATGFLPLFGIGGIRCPPMISGSGSTALPRTSSRATTPASGGRSPSARRSSAAG